MRIVNLVFLSIFILTATGVSFASDKIIDLSSPVVAGTVPIGLGVSTLTIVNLVPQKRYSVDVVVENVKILGLVKPSDVSQFVPDASEGVVADPCKDAIEDLKKKLTASTTESDVNTAIRESTLAVEGDIDCYGRMKVLLDTTKKSDLEFSAKKSQKVIVTIKRMKGSTTDVEREWVYAYETQKKGEWLASFGFGIIPSNDEKYHTSTNPDGSFTITKQNEETSFDPTGGVFYTWYGFEHWDDSLVHGPTLGLGVDTSNVTVFAGWNLTFHENIGISAGLVFHQQKRLVGQFSEGQIVKEALTEDALLEDVYRPNGFIAFTYRFQ